jgi:hypothetical protein
MRRHYLRKVDIQRSEIRKIIRDNKLLGFDHPGLIEAVERLDELLTKLFKYIN